MPPNIESPSSRGMEEVVSSPIFFESSPPSVSIPHIVSSPHNVSNAKVLDRLQQEKVPIEPTLKDRNCHSSKLDSSVSVFNPPPKTRLPLLNQSQQGVNSLQKESIDRTNNEAMPSQPMQQEVGDVLDSHERIIGKKLRDMMGDGLSLQNEFRNGITAIKSMFEDREKEFQAQLAAKNFNLQVRQNFNIWLHAEIADFRTKLRNASERVQHLESENKVKSGVIQELQEEIGHLNAEAVASRLQLRTLRVELATSRALGQRSERKNHDLTTNHISDFNSGNERLSRNNAAINQNLNGVTKSSKAIMEHSENIATKSPKVPELTNDVQCLGVRKRKRDFEQSGVPSQRMRSESKDTVRNDDGFNAECHTDFDIVDHRAGYVISEELIETPPDDDLQKLSAVKADGTVVAWQSLSDTLQNELRVTLAGHIGWFNKLNKSQGRTCLLSDGPMTLRREKTRLFACRACVKDRKFCIKKFGDANIVLASLSALDRADNSPTFEQVAYFRKPPRGVPPVT